MEKNTVILVIENDPDTTLRMEGILRSEGYFIFTAPTEALAITTAKEIDPSLIFVSLTMADGLEICKTIHSIEDFSKIPIIVLTPLEKRLKIRYEAEYGIVDSLDKSFSPEELILKTETVLSIKEITGTGPGNISDTPQYGSVVKSEVEDISIETVEGKPYVDTVKNSISNETGKEMKGGFSQPYEAEGLIEKSFEKQKNNPIQKNRKVIFERKRTSVLIIIIGVILIISAAGFFIWQGGSLEFKNILKTIQQKLPVTATPSPPKKDKVSESKPSVKPTVPEIPPAEISKIIVERPPKEPIKKATEKEIPFYSAQVGAFKNIENAEAITERLKKNGYDAFIHSITRGNEKVHRVLVGKFEEKKEAEKLASTLKTKEDISALVFSFDSLKNP